MNVWKWVFVVLMTGFGVWELVDGQWGWALLDFFTAGTIYWVWGSLEKTNSEPVKTATDLSEPPVTPPAALLRDEDWEEHVRNCIPCRNFWKDDDGR